MTMLLLCAVSFALPNAEFAKYHREITGRDPAPNAIAFAIDPKVSKTGNDAYVIESREVKVKGEDERRSASFSQSNNQTIQQSNNFQVRITGSNMRSVWYGLYDLLERRGGCHWFWDGDVVPKKESIDLSNLDVRDEARFEHRAIRYFAHRGLTRFQAEQWGPEDWKKEIDWCLKRRLNVFMLRIGMDDLFQRTFPGTCAYPDASRDLPGHGKGYDNRTLFWSLEYRGKLRQQLQRYAFDRGLEVPEDFGTMTHWYSRTPEDFLAKKNPPFIPQATSGYSERNGLVWDIRDDRWVDEYWKLTQTAVRDFGHPGPGMLHTIGLGERLCYTNRADNLKLKLLSLGKFLDRAHRDYPDSKVLIAGWDLYFTWFPEEVRQLVKSLDPKRDIVWDYEGDATVDYRDEMMGQSNNFTKWGVVGKFPYTYSIFLAFEEALDIRANYPLIERRQKIVQDDPMCKGYLLWPEASHTDTLCLRYFTANAWGERNGCVPIGEVLEEFCASRYGAEAAVWRDLWQKTIPASYLLDWSYSYAKKTVRCWDDLDDAAKWTTNAVPPALAGAGDVFRKLAELNWKRTPFTERDAIDLARTMGDRVTIAARDELMKAYHLCQAGKGSVAAVRAKAAALKDLTDGMAEVLALHTDYSLAESYDRLDAVEKVTNPNFANVLLENATCGYCFSHQYEAAEYWYKPVIHALADGIVARAEKGDRSKIMKKEMSGGAEMDAERDACFRGKTLSGMRPTLPRTQANYVRVMKKMAAAADAALAAAPRTPRAWGVHFDFHARANTQNGSWTPIYDKMTEDDVRAVLDAVQPDFIQVDCKGHPGFASYPSAVGNSAPSLAGDGMAVWRKVTKERGVGLYVHYSGVADQKYFTEHPDEAVKGADGWPLKGDRATRPNGRYVDEILIPQLKELAGKYGIDGAWVDGECWATRVDFDPRTVAQFERETGIALKGVLPVKDDAPNRRAYLDFMRTIFHRYMNRYVDEIHKAYPDFRITSNWAFTDVMPVEPCANLDYISGDLAPGNCLYAAMISGRAAASQGKPWDLMAWDFRNPGPSVPKTAVQLMQEAAVVISLGGGFQVYITQRPDGSPRLDRVRRLKPLASFVRARQPFCFGGRAEKQVGVLMSTEDFLACSATPYVCGTSRLHTQTLVALLADCGHSVSLLMDHHVKAGALAGYPVVAVPEVVHGLDPEVVKALVAYVKNGGSLFVEGPKACGLLAAAGLPCALEGAPSEKPRLFTLGGGLPGSVNAATTLAQTAGSGAQPIAWGCDGRTDSRDGVLAAVTPCGKGRVAAVAGHLSNAYMFGAQHDHRVLANRALALLYDPIVAVERANGLLQTVLLDVGGRRMIQLVNANGRHRDEQSMTEDFIPPVVDARLRLTLGKKPAALVLQPAGRPLDFQWQNGVAFVNIPRIDLHDIIEVK